MSPATRDLSLLPDRLRGLCQRLAETTDLRAGLEAVAWACDGLFSFYRVALVLPARRPDQMHVAAAWARRAEEELEGYGFELEGHPLAVALAAGTPQLRSDPQGDCHDDQLASLYRGEGKAEELSVPLPMGGRRGALVFASRSKGSFAEDQFPWFEDLARMVAVWVRPWAGVEAPYLLERQYHALLNGVLDGIAVVVEDAIIYANASFREILGVKPEIKTLGNFADWLHRESLDAFYDALAWVERKARVLPRLEVVGRKANGQPVQLEMGMQSIVYLGDAAVLVQVHNVSERVEREHVTQDAASSSDVLLRTLAQNIRGSLTSAIGVSRLLMEQEQEMSAEERREGLDAIRRSGSVLVHLLDSLTEYSAIGADRSSGEVVEIHQILDQVEAELAVDLQSLGAVLQARRIPPRVWGHRAEVASVFRNLLHNALVHRLPGVTPRILISGVGEEGTHYVFCVQDNGIGVEQHRAEEIFQLFSRSEGGGAGVGLSIVDRIIRSGGGRAWVESVLGSGSRFYFTLPKAGKQEE